MTEIVIDMEIWLDDPKTIPEQFSYSLRKACSSDEGALTAGPHQIRAEHLCNAAEG